MSGEIVDMNAGDEIAAVSHEPIFAAGHGNLHSASGSVDGGGAENQRGPWSRGDPPFRVKAGQFPGRAGRGFGVLVHIFGVAIDTSGRKIYYADGRAAECVQKIRDEDRDGIEHARAGDNGA